MRFCPQVLGAYIAWTTSSSGCEQMFSQLKRSPAELASSRVETDRRLAVVIGSDPMFDQSVAEKARELYGQLLPSGRSRTSMRNIRMDAGRKGKQKVGSKQAWIRKRKEAVDRAAALELVTPPRQPQVELPESLEKEANRQEALHRKRKAEAFLEGTLLNKEVTEEVRRDAAQKEKMDAANDRGRAKKFEQVTTQVSFRLEKQTKAWALRALPAPALLLGVRAEANCKAKLRDADVFDLVQDSDHWCRGIAFVCIY